MVKNVGIAVWLKLHQIKPNKFYYTHIKMPNIMQLKRNESAHWELKLKIDILVKWLKLTKAPVQSLSLAHALSLCNRECTDPEFWKVLVFSKRRGNACISCVNRTQLLASFSPTLPSFSDFCVAMNTASCYGEDSLLKSGVLSQKIIHREFYENVESVGVSTQNE